MGEAKRKGRQGQQALVVLRERIAAGEFGPPEAPAAYVVVLDKSVTARGLLLALQQAAVLPDVATLAAGEAMRVWEASPLFPYAVLCGGPGTADRRTLLAADLDRLTAQVLPQARQRVQAALGRAPGVLLALEDDAARAVLARTGATAG